MSDIMNNVLQIENSRKIKILTKKLNVPTRVIDHRRRLPAVVAITSSIPYYSCGVESY